MKTKTKTKTKTKQPNIKLKLKNECFKVVYQPKPTGLQTQNDIYYSAITKYHTQKYIINKLIRANEAGFLVFKNFGLAYNFALNYTRFNRDFFILECECSNLRPIYHLLKEHTRLKLGEKVKYVKTKEEIFAQIEDSLINLSVPSPIIIPKNFCNSFFSVAPGFFSTYYLKPIRCAIYFSVLPKRVGITARFCRNS